jgi:deoxyribose-phosphate aldolase
MTDRSFTARMNLLAHRLLSMTDLTSLNDTDDEQAIRKLLKSASTPAGKVAAVCCFARFIPVAAPTLQELGVALAVVTNFPAGGADVEAARAETAAAVEAGATEIDVVFPYRSLLSGDHKTGTALVRACREACGKRALLKVILETGQFSRENDIRRAAQIAGDEGADFLKTSTGKTRPGATEEAVAVLLDVMALYQKRGRNLGLKVSGGVRTIEMARTYLDMFEDHFGAGSATPGNFRVGASSLVRDILSVLG